MDKKARKKYCSSNFNFVH